MTSTERAKLTDPSALYLQDFFAVISLSNQRGKGSGYVMTLENRMIAQVLAVCYSVTLSKGKGSLNWYQTLVSCYVDNHIEFEKIGIWKQRTLSV